MPIAVEVVPEAQFDAWVASKGGSLQGRAKPASRGAAGSAGRTLRLRTPGEPPSIRPPTLNQAGDGPELDPIGSDRS